MNERKRSLIYGSSLIMTTIPSTYIASETLQNTNSLVAGLGIFGTQAILSQGSIVLSSLLFKEESKEALFEVNSIAAGPSTVKQGGLQILLNVMPIEYAIPIANAKEYLLYKKFEKELNKFYDKHLDPTIKKVLPHLNKRNLAGILLGIGIATTAYAPIIQTASNISDKQEHSLPYTSLEKEVYHFQILSN